MADLVRRPAPVPAFPLVSVTPAPRVGLAWTAGNPAALARDAENARTEFRGGAHGEDGAYRRPLDAGDIRNFVASASGWRPLGASSGVVGAVSVERAFLSDGAFADIGEPYAMTPHVFADSSGTDLGRMLARIEGAGGWQSNGWGLGVGLGHQSWDTRTGITQIPRFRRGSRSGVSLGLTRDFASERLTLGIHTRWLSEVQQLSLSTRQAETTVFFFEGYGEPVLTRLAPRQGYVRRVERGGGAAAIAAQVRAAGARWVAFGHVSQLDERQFEQLISNDPPTDHWDTNGQAAGIAVQAGDPDGRTHAVAMLRWSHVTGDASRAGLEEEGTLFEADESVLTGVLDLRFQATNGWTTGAHVSVVREDRDRIDRLARIRSSIQAWRPGLAVEAARTLTDQVTIGGGAGLAWYTPSGGIPNPSDRGDRYRAWIGPELSYVTTPSRTLAALVTLRWVSPGGQTVSLAAGYEHASVRESHVVLPMAPAGSRSAWNVAVLWVL